MTESEKNTISEILLAFTQQWVVHGHPLKTSFTVLHDQFIVLAADESDTAASGCSIDSSVQVIRQVEQQFALGLFERTNVVFLKGHQIETLSQKQLLPMLTEGNWSAETLVFNNTIATKGDLTNNWAVPARQTWLKRYLSQSVV